MNNKYIKLIAIIVPIILSIICIVEVVKNNNQAGMPIPKAFSFSGEYSYDGESWFPYSEDSDINALKGDIILKGHLDTNISKGMMLNFYSNHIGISVYINGERAYIDTPSEIKNYGIDLMSSMCGKRWEQMLCPAITTDDVIEFRFINYHKYGNENAYKEAISSLLLTPPDNSILEVYLQDYTKPFEMIGYALLIIAIMLLGASIAAVVFKSNMKNGLFKIGITTLFVGGYIMFDIMMIYLMDELLVIKTYGRQLCLMLAIYIIGIIVCDKLNDIFKKIAQVVMSCSAIVNLIIVICAIKGDVLLYDTLIYWETAQYIISGILIVLCILELVKQKKCILGVVLYVCMNLAIIMDMIGISYKNYYSGLWFKSTYIITLILLLFNGAKRVILDHQAALKNKKLKEELEQSRISVMLSQIQPHFLYNSLTSVMDLCDRDPKQAKNAIADFADYLRGNLSSLKTENLISFRTELAHIEKYLKLEKLRFQDELEIVYDIQSQDFMLPTLAVQPIIENAVKHGVGQKTGGGTVTIHTSETEKEYIIRITDDGVGFSEGEYSDDEGTHVGIENTRKRLDMMINARLEIESKKGEGTTASVYIPKRSD